MINFFPKFIHDFCSQNLLSSLFEAWEFVCWGSLRPMRRIRLEESLKRIQESLKRILHTLMYQMSSAEVETTFEIISLSTACSSGHAFRVLQAKPPDEFYIGDDGAEVQFGSLHFGDSWIETSCRQTRLQILSGNLFKLARCRGSQCRGSRRFRSSWLGILRSSSAV